MKKYFSTVGAGLCASLIISFSFGLVAPVGATASVETPTTGYLEPGMSREALAARQAEQAESQEATLDAASAQAGSVGASAVTAPGVFEKKVAGLSTFFAMSQQDSDDAGRVFLVWQDTRDGGVAVYFSRSLDQGTTWSSAKRLDRSSGVGTAGYVTVVTDGNCNVYAGWQDSRSDAEGGEAFVSVSRDCGDTWSSAKRLSSASVLQDGTFDLAVRPNGTVFAVWGDARNDPDPVDPGVFLTEIYSMASVDYGTTWQAEKKISDVAAATGDDYGPVATFAENGDILVQWLSDRAPAPNTYDVYAARSTNTGLSWAADFRMNTEAAGTQTIAGHGLCAANDHVYSMYTNAPIAGEFDVSVRASHDFGATFDAKIAVNTAALDLDTTSTSMDCAGDRAVVAFSAGPAGAPDIDGVYAATTADGGHDWTTPEKLDVEDPDGSGNDVIDLTSSITSRGDTVVAFTDERGASDDGYFNYSPDGGDNWQTSETDFTSNAGVHTVSLSREMNVSFSDPLDGEGASSDADAHAWLTYYDTRAEAPGMYSARLTFARDGESLERLAGATRIETALAISNDSYPVANTVSAMVVATSQAFPDGLAGGPLAALVGGPLLITPTGSLSDDVALEIDRLFDGQDDAGTDVYILGGGAAINPGVETAIAGIDEKLDIERLEGADRVATAIAIANEMNEIRGQTPNQAVLAYRGNFPDALAASAVASSSAVDPALMPILLSDRAALDPRVASWLTDNASENLQTLNIVGGTAALSEAVATAADVIVSTVARYGGSNRYGTAAILNSAMFTGAAAPLTIGVASGEKFPDALTGGAHSGRLNRPLVLVQQNNIPGESMSYVQDNASTISGGSVYGGTAAISDLVKSVMEALY